MTTMTKVEDRPAIDLAKEVLADREWLIPAGDDQLGQCWLCTFTHFNLKLLTVHLGIGKPNQHLVELPVAHIILKVHCPNSPNG
jgi:hypothetical protein